MKNIIETLKHCKLFEGIQEPEIQNMLNCLNTSTKTFDKGNIIMQEGEKIYKFGIVIEGSVQIVSTNYINGNQHIVATLNKAHTFGEVFAFAQTELPWSVLCQENCTIMLIDCTQLTTTCSHACSYHNKLIYNLLKATAQNNLLLQQKIEIMSQRTTKDKLLAYLNNLARKQNSNKIIVPFDRQQLADYLNVDRSGLSVEISKLIKSNVIYCHKNTFTLLTDKDN